MVRKIGGGCLDFHPYVGVYFSKADFGGQNPRFSKKENSHILMDTWSSFNSERRVKISTCSVYVSKICTFMMKPKKQRLRAKTQQALKML